MIIINNKSVMFNNQSKLSRMVQQQANSFEYHSLILNQVNTQLKQLKKDNNNFTNTFQSFCKDTNQLVADWIKKICSFLYRQLKEKHYLQSQLEKSKIVQQNMRNQVINLKEMIQTAIEDYQRQIQDKDNALKQKNHQIQILIKQLKLYQKNIQNKHDTSLRIEQSRKTQRASLEIIQEESEHATYSSQATIRDKDQKIEERILPETLTNHIELKQLTCSQIELHPVTTDPIDGQSSQKENNQQKYQHKRTKSFIDHFRKTIGESFSQKIQQQTQLIKSECKSPLRQIRLNQIVYSNNQFSHNLKECAKQPITFKTVYMHTESNQISKSSSNSDLIINNQAERINIPKKFQTTSNIIFFKKKDTPIHRVMTQPSPQRASKCQNNYFSSKPPNSQKRIGHQKKSSCEKSRSNHSIEDSKSMKSSLSKEKIKITAKMVDEMGLSGKKGNQSKALVYLGGKSIFRKFLIELKSALKQYTVYNGSFKQQIKYQGNRKNGMKWGRGRLIYQNGAIYEGEFKENMRHGRGSLSLNGIQIYQGLWMMDKMHGQGYIKSMKYMSKNCPSIFNEASYCGNLQDNRLHGIGTIFLNSKQKIVTKFLGGVPIGDLTYYNFHEIQFGVWPTQ